MTDAVPMAALRDLVRTGAIDVELGGLLWVLVEGGMPLVVAGDRAAPREALLRALASLREGDGDAVELAAADDPDPRSTARRFVAAAAEGLPVGATIEADDLEGVFARLEAPPIRSTRDELSHIGLVLVVEADATRAGAATRVEAGATRVVAAHWIRPLARDVHGHLQRLGPAVLAAREPRTGTWEHFAWGVMPELAIRLGRKAGDLEREVTMRAERLAAVPG